MSLLYKYDVWRKSDNCRIKSNDVAFGKYGIIIRDDIEHVKSDCEVFIPYQNIVQVSTFNDLDEVQNGN